MNFSGADSFIHKEGNSMYRLNVLDLKYEKFSIKIQQLRAKAGLSKKSKEMNWLDAPHALTEIRNSLVHPEHKKRGKYDIQIFIEAHNLSQWYLEMSILAICNYKGKYYNRLISGQRVGDIDNVPNVPWVVN